MLSGWPPGVKQWNDALDTPAVDQLHHIIALLMSRPYFERIPDQSLIQATPALPPRIRGLKQILRRDDRGRSLNEPEETSGHIMVHPAGPFAVEGAEGDSQ